MIRLGHKHYWLIGIVVFLIAIRAAMPWMGKKYINYVLRTHLTGYTGSIDDFDLSLWRGAYQLEGLKINKAARIPIPFLSMNKVDFSIAWKPLFRGRVVGKVHVYRGLVNFVKGPSPQQSQSGTDGEGWQKALDKIFPLKIEELRLSDSGVHFRDFYRQPKVDVYLEDLDLLATNLRNTQQKNGKLNSKLDLEARIKHRGRLRVRSQLNVLDDPISADLNLAARGVDLTAFNDFFKAYGHFDVSKGRLDLFAEAATRDGLVKGYVKPLLTHVDVITTREKINGIKELLSETAAGTINAFIRRYSKDQMGTKVPFEGRINDPKVGLWAAIGSLFSHAFAKELPLKIDKDININDVKSVRAR